MVARNTCVEDNIGLVYACAKRFINRGIEYEDIVQAGSIGLMKASKSFDQSRGVQFSTYAVPVILGEIKQMFRENGPIKVSRNLKDLSMKINREVERFVDAYDRNPSIGELSEILNVEKEQIFEALEASQRPISLTTVNDDNESTDLDIPVEFDEERISSRIALMNALNSLEKRDRYLIKLRFFESKTQSYIAKIFGETQVWVSRREKILLKELRRRL